MPSTLPYYWQLASSSKRDRLSSSHSLVGTLISQQKEARLERVALPDNPRPFDDGSSDSAATLQLDGKIVEESEQLLEAHNSTEVTYAIRRLIKGLASHRESSRLGFSVALCELIKQLKSVPARCLIILVLSYSTPSGKAKVKGQEERDLLFARLFGLYAVIRSDVLSNEVLAQERDFQTTVEIVWLLGKSKTWLRESSAWIIVEAVRFIGSSTVSWKDSSLKWLASKICEAREVGPESVAIYMAISSSSSTALLSTLPTLTSSHILASSNLTSLAKILKGGVEADADAQSAGGGSVQMQVHFVWDMILQQYSANIASSDEKKAPLSEVYRVLVDEALFASSASDQKKSWGFQIFEKALPLVAQDDIPCLFTTNFMRTWTNQLVDKNRMLFKAASKCVSTIQEGVKSNSSIGLSLLDQLLTKHADSNCPVKVIEAILSSMSSSEGVVQYIDHLIQSTKEDSDSKRRWALDQLSSVARNTSMPLTDDCICIILTFLAVHGFFAVKIGIEATLPGTKTSIQLPAVSFSAAIKSACRTRFFSCLGDVCDQSMTHIDGQERVKRKQGQMGSGQSWISKGFAIMQGLEGDTTHFTALFRFSKEDAVSQTSAFSQELIKAAEKTKSTEVKTKILDFHSMLLAGTLYLYKDLEKSGELGNTLIDPMIECGKRLVLKQKGQGGEPSAMELFIHCIVSYMEQSSAFLRSAATQTFATFTDELNREGLDQLLNQLGFNSDKDAESEEVEDADEDLDEEAIGSDEDLNNILSDTISETSATSVSSSKDVAVDPIFVAKVQEVLKAGGVADSDAESSISNEESSSAASEMSNFDDDQMLLIDDKLAEIFRQKLGSRKEEEEAKKETVALHIKVVDLLDVFARKQSKDPLCIAMVLPLFTIALEKDAALGQLKQRATTVLTKTLCRNKDGLNGTVPAAILIEPMEAIHKMAATKLPTPELNLCSTVNIYLTKACIEVDLLQGQIRSLYLATLQDFMQRKSNNLRPQFLIDAFQRSPLLGFSLRSDLLKAVSEPQQSAKDSFRQLQAWEMLRVTLTSTASTASEQRDLVAFLPLVSDKILDIVVKEKMRLKEIVKIALDLARLSKRICKSQADLERIWSPVRINEVIELVGANDQIPNAISLQVLLRQLLAIVNVSEREKATSNGKRKGGGEKEQAIKRQKKKSTS